MSSYETRCQEDARLTILSLLGQERDGRTNSASITRVLDSFGIRRSREWVELQIRFLADLGAVRKHETDLIIPGIGSVVVAEITRSGREHLEKRSELPGVSRPADAE